MEAYKISGRNEDEVWRQINPAFILNPDLLNYTAVIEQGNKRILLDVDIELGGGFESGYATTTLSAELSASQTFRFAIHREHFTDEIGKFFGMEDVVIGFSEFDDRLIIKTNDSSRIRKIFAEPSVRNVFLSLDDFTFGITQHKSDSDEKVPFLELNIETGITDPAKLREIYHAFFTVMSSTEDEVEQII